MEEVLQKILERAESIPNLLVDAYGPEETYSGVFSKSEILSVVKNSEEGGIFFQFKGSEGEWLEFWFNPEGYLGYFIDDVQYSDNGDDLYKIIDGVN